MSIGFGTQLNQGILPTDIEPQDKELFEQLIDMGALELKDGLYKLNSLYRIGRLYIDKSSRGYIEAQSQELKDLVIEPDNLSDAKRGDIVLAKRFIARRGRASGKIVAVLNKARLYTIVYTHKDELGNFYTLDIRTGEPTSVKMDGMDLSAFKLGTVLKADIDTDEVVEVLGHLGDDRVDEKISLALHNRSDKFEQSVIDEALQIEQSVDAASHTNRVDLRELDFCTIDPVTAKDFDDAIYFDTTNYILYVAIADVSHYVEYFSEIDKEAKHRGFTTYFPHKSFPMLPRELSENICSLKPKVDRLAFVSKITLDKQTLQPTKEEFFEAIIHSKHRFNYDAVDGIIANGYNKDNPTILNILSWLMPLYEITKKLRKQRLSLGFDFRSEEIKLSIDDNHELTSTQVETGTPSHSLIEECMLLANRASAKRFEGEGDGIFRIHEPPQLAKIEELLSNLAIVGVFVEEYEDSPELIRLIQQEAKKLNIESEVDEMIIKSLRQASYSSHNVGHFGLGFSHYSHFTSPIRRYSDLILHRLIKAQLKDDKEQIEYLLRNIEPLCVMVSELERVSTKAEWDFRDRKLTRWASKQKGAFFEAKVIEAGESAKAELLGDIKGVVINLKGDNLMLFDKIRVMITEVNIPQCIIMAELVNKIESIAER
jgi:ribonuclease R